MKIKKPKRIMSLFLAALMCVTSLVGIGTTAYAAEETDDVYLISYPRDGDSNYNAEWGHGSLTFMNGWKTGTSRYTTVRAMGSYNGNICYCIEIGVPQQTGDSFTKKGEDFWDNYPASYNSTISPDDIKLFIGRIFQYGYTGTISTSWRSQNEGGDKLAHAVATQLLIWETVIGERDENFNKVSTGGRDAVLDQISRSHPIYDKIMSYYNSMAASVQKHSKLPSFLSKTPGSAQEIELKWDGSKYTVTLTDSNNVLSGYKFSSNNSGVQFSVSGNKLTITAEKAPSDGLTITAEKTAQRKGVITWTDGIYGPNGGVQDTVTYLHCHFVINSVSFADGKRLKDKEKSWYYFRHIADEICLEHKLSIVEKPELHRSPAYLTKKDEAGMPTRYNNAKKAIDEAIAMSRNLRQFQYELGVMGYHSNFSPNRKYATVTPKGSEKPIRTYRLGEEYTKEKILERLTANRDNIVFKPFQPKTYIVRQYRLPTRESKIQKVDGLYGLYLYYCYRLGYLPKHNQKQQNTARLHYLLKDDLMKMDELTKQVTLLGKHQIGTDEQLFSYKRSVEDEIKTLTADRTHLRNEIRKVDISDERLSAAKMKISAISERLKELRKEVKLCDGIAKRSGVIADTLSQVKAEEEKSQRKESRNYEQRR